MAFFPRCPITSPWTSTIAEFRFYGGNPVVDGSSALAIVNS
ncbi:hypothetical protein Pla52o_51840 [Novipirellula galeiformis]|uniref:Uncharacterized protein n=1 Tax=Novipirellula galeiformis TaxID=2528004 RepID=A0A5C6BYH4_9BACT|nr:hypothetical protein Pla52o_51840 [Novipirellula galeiformis]